jgi:hypothetical protein
MEDIPDTILSPPRWAGAGQWRSFAGAAQDCEPEDDDDEG